MMIQDPLGPAPEFKPHLNLISTCPGRLLSLYLTNQLPRSDCVRQSVFLRPPLLRIRPREPYSKRSKKSSCRLCCCHPLATDFPALAAARRRQRSQALGLGREKPFGADCPCHGGPLMIYGSTASFFIASLCYFSPDKNLNLPSSSP
jgi:hypothetical protein